jgi:hypothetical protein
MAYLSKIEDYPTRQVKVAQFAKALSHPARIAIIEHLHQYGECFCGGFGFATPQRTQRGWFGRSHRDAAQSKIPDSARKLENCQRLLLSFF